MIGAFAFAPIGSVILCAAIANTYGCKVDEGSVHPCIINGHDYGELLYSLGVMGWLMLVSIPGGLFALAGWLVFLILHRASWRQVGRQRGRADHSGDNGADNFRVPLHTDSNLPEH